MNEQISKIKSEMYRLKQSIENNQMIRKEIREQAVAEITAAYSALDKVQELVRSQT